MARKLASNVAVRASSSSGRGWVRRGVTSPFGVATAIAVIAGIVLLSYAKSRSSYELGGAELAVAGVFGCIAVAFAASRRRRPPSVERVIAPSAPSAPRDPLVDRLQRRLTVVTSTFAAESVAGLARRLSEAVREETSALCVRLHVVQDEAARELELVAEVGASEHAASDASLWSTIKAPRGLTALGGEAVALLDVRTAEGAAFVLEVVCAGPIGVERLREVDALARLLAPAICQRVAAERSRRMSRVQRAIVAAAQETELDAVFEALADGIAVTDHEGGLVRLNAAGREILGMPGIGDSSFRVSLAAAHNPLLEALREGTKASGLEVAMKSVTGERRVVQVKLSRLSNSADSRATVAVFRDVTRERQLEHELRAQGVQLERHVKEVEAKHLELERATRLKSEFLANMSHELRTPLNAVLGFTEVLLDGTYGSLNDRQRDCAGDVLAGGRHLLGLINDVLDLSKIEAGKMELAREDLDLADVLSQALTLVRPQIAAKSIVLDLDVAANVFWAHADADRIRQVLVNLLSNAVKFTSNGGAVRVEARLGEGGATRVTVIDSGIGIPPEHANRLFKDFSQVDGSITRRFGGTGLGLAISKRLVEMHGGTIGFTSAASVGSQFFFTVPAAQRRKRPAFTMPPPAPRVVTEPASVARSHDRVLVLDTDPAAGRLAAGLLIESGLMPEWAATLAEARELIAQRSFDGILLDPDLDDGTQADALAFAKDHFGAGVVVNSTRARDELDLESDAVFLAKPIDRASMIENVNAVIARRRGVRRAVVVDPNDVDGSAVQGLLEREGFLVDRVRSLAEARAAIARRRPNVAILELELADGDGSELLAELRAQGIASVVLTGRVLEPSAQRALEQRAQLVTRKGTLSRLAFAQRVTEAIARLGASRARVLAVDDNEQNLRLISAVLAQRGCEVLEARDAASALAVAREQLPDVILMDVMLPDIDGLTATRELKGDPRTRAIPVIAVTANAMAGDEEKARQSGCCGYVTKPFDSAKLLRALDLALATSSRVGVGVAAA